jgi:hypothetical protein
MREVSLDLWVGLGTNCNQGTTSLCIVLDGLGELGQHGLRRLGPVIVVDDDARALPVTSDLVALREVQLR